MTTPSARDLHALLSEFTGADAPTVARGLTSPRPTGHLVVLNGDDTLGSLGDPAGVATWCALDCLLVAHLLGRDARIESIPPAPQGSAPLRFAVTGGRVVADPAWVLSFPHVTGADGAHFTEAFCPYANVFASLADYRAWAVHQPRPTTPIDLATADAIARRYAGDVLRAGDHAGDHVAA